MVLGKLLERLESWPEFHKGVYAALLAGSLLVLLPFTLVLASMAFLTIRDPSVGFLNQPLPPGVRMVREEFRQSVGPEVMAKIAALPSLDSGWLKRNLQDEDVRSEMVAFIGELERVQQEVSYPPLAADLETIRRYVEKAAGGEGDAGRLIGAAHRLLGAIIDSFVAEKPKPLRPDELDRLATVSALFGKAVSLERLNISCRHGQLTTRNPNRA